MKNYFYLAIICTMCMLLAMPMSIAKEQNPLDMLRESMTYVSGLDSLSFGVNMQLKISIAGESDEIGFDSAVKMQGEHDLNMVLTHPDIAAAIIGNSEKSFVHFISENEYLEQDAAPREQLMATMPGGPLGMAAGLLSLYLHNNPILIGEMLDIQYVGEEEIDGVMYHHLLNTAEMEDIDIWLTTDENPKLHKFVLNASRGVNMQVPDSDAELIINVSLKDWEGNVSFPENTFVFTPPEDATKFSMNAMMGQSQGDDNDTLLGKEAPDFTLERLDDGEVRLSEFRGQKVIILDFWASWCGPCRQGLPILQEVAAEFADKEVVMFAINVAESNEVAKQFLEEAQLQDITVIMDRDRAVSTQYEAHSLPKTVIIGMDGVIRKVHNGFHPNLGNILRSELDEVLALSAEAA